MKENIKAPRHWSFGGEFTGTGEFPAQRASNAENVSIWWHHHVQNVPQNRCSILFCFVFQWITRGPFHYHGLAIIPAYIGYHTHYKVWVEITYPFPNFSGATVEVWEWVSNFIPHFTGHVIICAGTKVNSLWPSDAIWRQGSRSTLVQVLVCCLTASSHYMNQCWLVITKAKWCSYESNFAWDIIATSQRN